MSICHVTNMRPYGFNPIQDGPFRGCSWMGRGQPPLPPNPFPKVCHTYPTMMKLGTLIPYLKKNQKLYKSRDTPPEFCWHQQFLPEISKFCYIKKYRYRLYFGTLFLILLTIFESCTIFLINMFTILMISVKMATLGFFKIKVF